MNLIDFTKKVGTIDTSSLQAKANRCRGDILTMTTLAGTGHPGGSMSSLDMLLAIYSVANINSDNCNDINRDRVIVSHGHISPAVYSCLAEFNFLPKDDVISQFRKAGSTYEGHIERSIKGVEWSTGNLGQGLSAACGFASAAKVKGLEHDIYVLMGDGEQQKGQIVEARRFAKKYRFNNITAIIDYNDLQISGCTDSVMPCNLTKSYEADGWLVLEVDGHDFYDIFAALIKAKSANSPCLILAKTIMGKGVTFMENKNSYHGSTLPTDKYLEAMSELKLEPKLDKYKKLRSEFTPTKHENIVNKINIKTGEPITYNNDVVTDNRSAFGAALDSIVELNKNSETPIVVFDCDLAGSVKTNGVEKHFPNNFFQAGISEHHTAVCAGASSVAGVVPFFADFGMFGVDEVYNQHRLNAINETNLKLVTTHVGVDVGEDGKTHMCIDYIGLMRNIFGFKIITPADPNQTDRAIRYASAIYGNVHVAMGRSKLNIILNEKSEPYFAGNYKFEYGKIDIIRKGDINIFSYGSMLHRAIKVADILKAQGLSVGVINVSTPAHIYDEKINELLKNKNVFVYEDHISSTGLFSTLANISAMNGLNAKITAFGVNEFPFSGAPDEVFKLLGLSPVEVAQKIFKAVKPNGN